MQIPVPTDNLFKFLCLSALVGYIALGIWQDKQISDLKQRFGEYERSALVLTAESENVEDDIRRIESLITRVEKSVEDGNRESALKDFAAVESLHRALGTKRQALRLKRAELDANGSQLKRLLEQLNRETRKATWQNIALFLVFSFGLVSWYLSGQVHQDRLLRAQAESAEVALRKEKAAAAASEGNRPVGQPAGDREGGGASSSEIPPDVDAGRPPRGASRID